jgi:L-2-hydroxyglutarate oxidase LhgO
MVSDSQREFNRFIGGYIDRLPRSRIEDSPSFSRPAKRAIIVPQKKPVLDESRRVDKAVIMAEREMEITQSSDRKGKGFLASLKEVFFGPPPAVDESPEPEDEFDDDDLELYGSPEKKVASQSRPRAQPVSAGYAGQPASAPRLGASVGFYGQNLRNIQPASAKRPEIGKLEEKYPYSPNAEKDIKYLLGLVNSLLNKLERQKRDEFYRSSEFRIFESIRKKY